MKKLHPVTILFLGAVPALAASVDVRAALGMSIAVMGVLLCSALVLGLVRKLIPQEAKLAAVTLVVAGFASMAQLLLQALLPSLFEMLGFYLAILAVDLLLFGSGEDAADFGLGKGLLSALENGFCFAVFVLLLAGIRELFGAASFAGAPVAFLEGYKIPLLLQAPGGFIVLSLVAALVNKIFPARSADTAWVSALAEEKKEEET
jgi:electron transport complex protein RnfE